MEEDEIEIQVENEDGDDWDVWDDGQPSEAQEWHDYDQDCAAPFTDVSTVTEYGLTQKLSNAVRCF